MQSAQVSVFIRLAHFVPGSSIVEGLASRAGETAMFMMHRSAQMPTPEQALPGRDTPLPVPEAHYVNGHRLQAPFPEGFRQALFGMGCFWGA